MSRCTEPERWASVPEADAAEEEVARYLAHVEECPFHAAVERREAARVRGVAALARGESGAPGSGPHEHAAGRGDDGRAGRGKSRRPARLHTLSIRVNGKERVRLDLAAQRRVALEVEAGALITVWQPEPAGGGEEVYLTSYVLPAGGEEAGGKKFSATVLEGGERISFSAEAGADAGMRVTVGYAAAGRWRVPQLSAARLPLSLAEYVRTPRRSPSPRLAVTMLALATALLLALGFFLQTEEPVPVANREQPRQPSAEPAPSSAPAPSPAGAQERDGAAPAASNLRAAPAPTPAPRGRPGSRRGPRGDESHSAPLNATAPRTGEQPTVATVRRIYVSAGEGAGDQHLRAALIERLRAGSRFTVVTSERRADAVLRPEQSRGTGVSVQLLTRTGKTLWFTTQPAAGHGVEEVKDVAARIVNALTTAADKSEPPVNTPRR